MADSTDFLEWFLGLLGLLFLGVIAALVVVIELVVIIPYMLVKTLIHGRNS